MSGVLTVRSNSFFKLRPERATTLLPKEKYQVFAGDEFRYSFIDDGEFKGHWKVHFDPPIYTEWFPLGVQTWYVYPGDVFYQEGIVPSELNVSEAPSQSLVS